MLESKGCVSVGAGAFTRYMFPFFCFLFSIVFCSHQAQAFQMSWCVCLNVVDGARATCVALGNTGNKHCFSTMTVICRTHNCGCAQARAAVLRSHMHAISVLSDKGVVEAAAAAAVALGSSENRDWGGWEGGAVLRGPQQAD